MSRHFWGLILLQLALFLNLFFNFFAELNWEPSVLNDALRIGGMITTSFMILLFPNLADSRRETSLHPKTAQIFKIIGLLFSIHYLISALFFFLFRYDGSFQYFGGYRYIPAYSVFISQGFSIGFTCLCVLKASSSDPKEEAQLSILRSMVYRIGLLFPLVFVVDLVRYFIPVLWKIYPEEKLFVTPLCFFLLNLYFNRYAKLRFTAERKNDFPKLSARESDVAQLLCQGLSYKDIGSRLFISLATVRTHVSRIYQKTGVKRKEDFMLQYQNKEDLND